MRSMFIGLVALFTLGACYREYQPEAPGYSYGGSDPQVMQGPPGGEADPGYAMDPAQDPAGYAADESGQIPAEAPGEAAAASAPIESVTDAEIDATLAPHGTWVEEEGYGRVWRPSTTVVGAEFTPYETCGSWMYTEHGWTFSCDWDWGWLPFHYGQWQWFDNYWGWYPGYEWSPAWVDWRTGGSYVGWRPRSPIIRDHTGRGGRVVIRDHRRPRDRDWRFIDRNHLGNRPLRGSTFHRSDVFRATREGARPPAGVRIHSSRDVMRGRIAARSYRSPRGGVHVTNGNAPRGVPHNAGGPRPRGVPRDAAGPRPRGEPPRGPYNTPQGGYQPRGNTGGTYQPPRGPYNTPQGGYQPRGNTGGTYQPPRGPYNTPRGGYQPRGNTGGTYQGPARPSGGSYQPSRPSAGSYQPSRPSAPSRSYDAPRSSSPSRSHGSSSRGSSGGIGRRR